jgi:stress response protein SCP2
MIQLSKKGQAHEINLQKSQYSNTDKSIRVKMTWETAIDLDLHAFVVDEKNSYSQIFFAHKLSKCGNILLDQDAGVGNVAGDNQENLYVKDYTKVKKIVFAANIFRFFGNLFSSSDNFSKYNGKIHIKSLGNDISVHLNSKEYGRWALIALFEVTVDGPRVTNLDSILKSKPTEDFIKKMGFHN